MFVFYCFSLLNLITASFVAWLAVNKKAGIFHPIFIFSCGHLVSYFFCAMIYQYSGPVFKSYEDILWAFNWVAPLSWLFFILTISSYFFLQQFKRDDKAAKKVNTNKYRNCQLAAAYLLLIIGVLGLVSYYIMSGRHLAGISKDYSIRVTSNRGLGFFSLLAQIGLNWSAGIFAYLMREKKIHKVLLVNLGYFLIGLVFFVIYGGRTTSFFSVIVFVSVSLMCKTYVFKKTIVPVFVLTCFGLCLQSIRHGSSFDKILESLSDKILLGLKGAYGDFGGLLLVLAKFPEQHDFLYFSQFKDVVIYWIPRYFYPDKPIQFGTSGYLTRTMLDESTYSYVLMNIGEWYVNLGILGILLGALLIGFFLFLVDRFFLSAIQCNCPYKLTFCVSLLFSVLALSTRSSLESLFIGLTPHVVVFFLLNFFTYKKVVL